MDAWIRTKHTSSGKLVQCAGVVYFTSSQGYFGISSSIKLDDGHYKRCQIQSFETHIKALKCLSEVEILLSHVNIT